MWYHYLLLVLGAYIVLVGIYDLVTNKQAFNSVGWTVWTITRVVGLVLIYIGWSGISTPVPAYAPTTGVMGGLRRRLRR